MQLLVAELTWIYRQQQDPTEQKRPMRSNDLKTSTGISHIHLILSVPVLSEAMTLTQLRVLTVVKFLTRTWFLVMFLATRRRERVNETGRPVGMKATDGLDWDGVDEHLGEWNVGWEVNSDPGSSHYEALWSRRWLWLWWRKWRNDGSRAGGLWACLWRRRWGLQWSRSLMRYKKKMVWFGQSVNWYF